MKNFKEFLNENSETKQELNESIYVRGSATLHIDGSGEVYELSYTIPSAIKGADAKITQRSIGNKNMEIGAMNVKNPIMISSICEVLVALGSAQEVLAKIKKGMNIKDTIMLIENTSKFIGKPKIDKIPELNNDINHVFIEWS